MPKPNQPTCAGKRAKSGPPTEPPPGPKFLPPLRPHRKLFYFSAALVAACLAAWLTLYFAVVRH